MNKMTFFKYCILLKMVLGLTTPTPLSAQKKKSTPTHPISKKISPHLFGLFFEDINYAADGGLYAEMIQNRSFEYSPTDRKDWHSLTAWEYLTPGFSYGSLSVETQQPIHPNNPHYLVLTAEHIGFEGLGIKNAGYANMVVTAGEQYNFSMFTRQLSTNPVTLKIKLQDKKGAILDWREGTVDSKDWQKQNLMLSPSKNCDSTSLVIVAVSEGKLALDVISLFPEQTFNKRPNGMRADLAQALADMKPGFMRFPGGCLVHGDGVGNMYRWKNTIGPIETRLEQKNIWGYHQTGGLGFYEYFQLCEDLGAKPVPVLPAGVSCQNSGGTWRIGGTGQMALPQEEMDDYVQEVLDLVEWANGSVETTWGAYRAAAGHPAPFNLEYVGIGNEEKITPEFEERFQKIYSALKVKHPEITVIGTAGPGEDGDDFDKGWKLASSINLPVIDEHYYKQPDWFKANLNRYDTYDRNKSIVYLGEYASWGNKLINAITEAAYMIGLERNGDIVRMASYAPMFAKKDYTQWRTDMIFFDNSRICLTPNYYVQQIFSVNRGDAYIENIISKNKSDTALSASAVQDSRSGDLILKLVNTGDIEGHFQINLAAFQYLNPTASLTVLAGGGMEENTLESPNNIVPKTTDLLIGSVIEYTTPPMSLNCIRIQSQRR